MLLDCPQSGYLIGRLRLVVSVEAYIHDPACFCNTARNEGHCSWRIACVNDVSVSLRLMLNFLLTCEVYDRSHVLRCLISSSKLCLVASKVLT